MRQNELLLSVEKFVISSVDSSSLGQVEGMELQADDVDEVQKILTIIEAVGDLSMHMNLVDDDREGR